MPTQLQLEGPDLESLLTRVKTELGAGARIVQAEKVRTGGVGGFFAKQRFEITVEVEDSAVRRPDPLTPPAPLLDAPDRRVPAARPALRATDRAAELMIPAPLLDAPTSLLDLADQVSATERTAAGAPPTPAAPTAPRSLPAAAPATFSPLSTETDTFASMLARLGVESSLPETPAAPAAAHATSPAHATTQAHATSPAPAAPPARPRASLLDTAYAGAGSTDADAPYADSAPVDERPALPRQRAASEPGSAVSLRPAADVAVRQPRAAAVQIPAPMSAHLARLGLPDHLQPTEGALYPALLESLRRLPKVPKASNRAGGVLAVVGPLPLALDVAREIARELGLPLATSVVLATGRHGRTDLPAKQVLRTPDAAATRRDLWRRRRNLTLVAVDAPLTAAGAAQARAFLAALAPTTTYGVVEATRKAHDVGAWARALGGVQALALTGVEETADPAAVLELGIPVGRLGGQVASPAAWAALLTGRLAA